MKDKDPFANTDAKPKDNVTAFGVLARFWFRSSRIGVWVPLYLIFGIIFYVAFNSSLGFLIGAIYGIYRFVTRFRVLED